MKQLWMFCPAFAALFIQNMCEPMSKAGYQSWRRNGTTVPVQSHVQGKARAWQMQLPGTEDEAGRESWRGGGTARRPVGAERE